MSQAVSGPAPEEQVALAAEHEGVFVPVLGVGGDHVQVTADEGDHFVGGAGVLDDDVSSTFYKGDTLCICVCMLCMYV
jgi:hypothetical protein